MQTRAFCDIDFDVDYLSLFGVENAPKRASKIDPRAQEDAELIFRGAALVPKRTFKNDRKRKIT